MTNNSSDHIIPNAEEATRLLYKNWREKFIMPLLIGTLIIGVFVLIPAVQSAGSLIIKAIFIASYVLIGIVTVIRFSYFIRISVFLLSIYALGLSELIRYGILGDATFFFLALIVFSTLLLSPQAGITAMVADTLTTLLIGWLMLSGKMTPLNAYTSPAVFQDWLSGGGMVVMFGAIIILGFQRLKKAFLEAQAQIDINLSAIKDERNNLEKKVAERTQQLRKVNDIGRTISAILNPDELLTRAANIISDEFECYYTAIFLTDASSQWAELKVATGNDGQVLLKNKYHLDINGKNAVGTAIRNKQAYIISDIESSSIRLDTPLLPYTRNQIAVRLDNPLLPNTRSQITIPLTVGENVIGALEMHSTKENAFIQQDADAYENMANQIAIALENSRLFREAEQSLHEMSATQQQYLQGVWQSLTSEQKFEHTIGNSDTAGKQEIEIPLTLRDQKIGQINMSSIEEWTPEQKSIIESVALQAALALENARLVEESQSIAMRERFLNEVTSKIWASTTIDSILQTTVRELGRALEATEVDIEVTMSKENE